LNDRIERWRLRRLVQSPAVSLILIHYATLAVELEAAWIDSHKTVFVHGHGFDLTWDFRDHGAPATPVHTPSYPAAVERIGRRATIIVTTSRLARRLAEVGVPAERIQINPLGVPVPEQCPPPRLDDGVTRILYLGRLVDLKGPDLVIRAFELAIERGLNGRLIMVGDGPLRTTCELLRARSRAADRIELRGAMPPVEARAMYPTVDMFSAHNCLGPLSRQEEAFGVSMLEAMAAGLPVVNTSSGGSAELGIDGSTAVLVEPGDVVGHAEAFLALSRDRAQRRRMGAAGWQRVRDHFSLERHRTGLRSILGLL
jgi:glycosyltransferase involved in cell wall biosynthesis